MDAPAWTGSDDRESRLEDRPDPIWLVCVTCDGAEEFATVDEGPAAGWRRRQTRWVEGRDGILRLVHVWDCPMCAETRFFWGGEMTTPYEPDRVIDTLTYCAYRFNRTSAPKIAPERWRLVFLDADALEQRYQAELAGATLLRETFSGQGFGD